MKEEIPTPRTDAFVAQFNSARMNLSLQNFADFARELERELAQTKAIAAELAEALGWYAEVATALERYGLDKSTDAILACVAQLELDGGKRASVALAKWKEGTK